MSRKIIKSLSRRARKATTKTSRRTPTLLQRTQQFVYDRPIVSSPRMGKLAVMKGRRIGSKARPAMRKRIRRPSR